MLIPQLFVGDNAVGGAVVVVHFCKVENIHGLPQAVVVIEKFKAASDREENFRTRSHMQSVNGAGFLNDKVSRLGCPRISICKLKSAIYQICTRAKSVAIEHSVSINQVNQNLTPLLCLVD
jgi:hypothetical protein